jgi:3',5'-nucleoside bisphosphate phosphatase
MVDLHAHTMFSDGLFTPEQLVVEAQRRGLAAVGVTDHDAVGGIERALVAGRQVGIEVVPGVELSCSVAGIDLHMLGYYIDFQDAELGAFVKHIRTYRAERGRLMVEKLQELGLKVTMEQVKSLAKDAAIGRPHVAQAMVDAGAVPNVDEAFKRYIGYEGPAYVPKKKLSPKEGVDFIKAYGGVSVVAHPATYGNDDAVYQAIAAGVDGVEVWHPDHNANSVAKYLEIAQKNHLLTTGGSDCHGGRKKGRIFLGDVRVPYEHLAAVKKVAQERREGSRDQGIKESRGG